MQYFQDHVIKIPEQLLSDNITEMTATAGILPEFMLSIYKNFKNGNKELQFAILELIRVMKSLNFSQGFKEALSVRGINIGLPKMAYSKELISKK